jgi:hypothetical protein
VQACHALAEICIIEGRRDEAMAWLVREAGGPTSPEELEELLSQGASGDAGAWQALARNPSITPEVARQVYAQVHVGGVWVLRYMAGNPATPGDVLESITNNGWMDRLPHIVGENLMADLALLERLALSIEEDYEDEDGHYDHEAEADDTAARAGAARNPATPASVLKALLFDPDLWVRVAYGENPAADPAAHIFFTDWAKDSDSATASKLNTAMAANIATAESIWHRIATSEDAKSKRALIDNPAAPAEIKALARLSMMEPN